MKTIILIIIGNIKNFLKLNDDENKNNISKINNAREVLSPLNKIMTKELTNKIVNRMFFFIIEWLKIKIIKKNVKGKNLTE